MQVQLVGSTEKIRDTQEAKRWVQNHARICYTEKTWDELVGEGFKEGLVASLISRGHHSPFDHFNLSFYLEGPAKMLAMVLNNQGVYTTSEKSARYTVMKVPERQKQLYEKWDKEFLGEISTRFPENKFPTLYKRGGDGKTPAEKLAQENARYMTSVFTPTQMSHTVSWRQMNILYHGLKDFISSNESSSDEFSARLANSMKGFTEAPEIKKWVIEEAQVRMKGGIPLRLVKPNGEETFTENVYSVNYLASFASLAQLHRHRLATCTISYGQQKGASLGFYVPRLIEASGKEGEWISDLRKVSETDFSQAQLLSVNERGMREYLPAKAEERECGLAQLETARVVGHVLERYSKNVSSMGELRSPICLKDGCKKGGCTFGAKNCLERLI